MNDAAVKRCAWVPDGDSLYARYHDTEWGVPLRDDQALFELLVLETFQAGLSWRLILGRREAFRAAFAGFDARQLARWSDEQIEQLLLDPTIIRNRAKLLATRGNARAFLALQAEHGSFQAWLWQFTDGTPLVGHWREAAEVPARTSLSDRVSAAMRRAGFRFVGSVTVYSYLQAAGLVQDHLVSCFRYRTLTQG